jgi:hypothetical protein
VLWLLVTANVVMLADLVTLMMEVICSSKMSFLRRAIQRNISEEGILQVSKML